MLSHIGTDVQLVSTSRTQQLGEEFEEQDNVEGRRIWRYVFNDEAATAFAVGDIIIADPSATTEDLYGGLVAGAAATTASVMVLGVAQHAIAFGSYGWVLIKGKGLVKNGTANITADTPITPGGDRAGSAIDFAAGAEHRIIGYSLEAEATNDTTFDARLHIP